LLKAIHVARYKETVHELSEFFLARWLMPRAKRDPSYKTFERESFEENRNDCPPVRWSVTAIVAVS